MLIDADQETGDTTESLWVAKDASTVFCHASRSPWRIFNVPEQYLPATIMIDSRQEALRQNCSDATHTQTNRHSQSNQGSSAN